MRIINCCGYGNTGCTAQCDFLGDHIGVAGALRPFHELGFLKCSYSFGGILLAILHKWAHVPTKDELRRSLQGLDPKGPVEMNEGAKMHLELRALMATRNGEAYVSIVDEAVRMLPENYNRMNMQTLIPHLRAAVGVFILGITRNIQPGHFVAGEFDEETSVLGFKNDPPGSYPILATMLMGGQTSAILRDPRDTTYDFNRHYGLGHTMQTVINHCAHYNAQLNSARNQIKRFEKEIQPFYKVIDFENLVNSESFRNRYRDFMIGPRERVRFSFDHEKSSQNIDMYGNMSKEFVEYVEDNCMANYDTYRKFLKERDLLLE